MSRVQSFLERGASELAGKGYGITRYNVPVIKRAAEDAAGDGGA